MKLETNSERVERFLMEAKENGTMVPSRSLPRGKQWVGHDIPGRGKAAQRRLRQLQKQVVVDETVNP